MVLKAPPLEGARGVTLLELLIAVSLGGLVVGMGLALYKDVARTAGLVGGRMQGDFQAQAQFAALSRNLMFGGGVVRVASDGMDLLNRRGRRVEYLWRDSALTVNGTARSFRLGSLVLEIAGPPVPMGEDGYPDWNAAPGLDSLDEDRNGQIGFDELDRDGDGELGLDECRLISQVRITMTTVPGTLPTVRSILVHPRNHARDSLPAAEDPETASDPLE